jgi:transposase
MKAAVTVFAELLKTIKAQIEKLDEQIAQAHEQSGTSLLLAGVPGVGKLAATAIVASLPDPRVFKSGRDFSAWLGLTPRQNSTGGKEKLGAITKKGNAYIRRLLVLGGAIAVSDCGGATSLLRVITKRKGALGDWINALRERKSARLVTVALANKLARIIWAMMMTGEVFRRETFARA